MLSKRSLTRLAFVLMLLISGVIFYSAAGNAQEKSSLFLTQEKELIIQIEGMNEKNTVAVRKAIESNDGVVFKGICHTNNILMYVVDRDIHTDNSFVDAALAPLNLTYLVKDGATISQVQSQCADSSTDNSNPTE